MKKFLKKAEGFTLVELIVVIAILGILTAIAVPTYSGYVKKANEANDTQTLSAVNTAIAAACTENGVAMEAAYDHLVFDAEAGTDGCTVTVAAAVDEDETDVLDDFKSYYGYEEDGIVFKYYKNVEFSDDADEAPLGNLVGSETAAAG